MSNLRFERFEFKYFVPEGSVEKIRRFIAPWTIHDAEAGERIQGAYTITNLYFDTPDFALWRAQLNGAPDRYKLRARTYGVEADGPLFLEVKRKIKDVIVKTRGFVPRRDWPALLRDMPLDTAQGESGGHRADFVRRMLLHGAIPQVLLRYEREAYESRFGDYARVTFDRAVRYQPARGLDLVGDPDNWTYLDTGIEPAGFAAGVVLELKFPPMVPRWMYDLINTMELKRVSSSKYFTAIRHHRENRFVGHAFEWQASARN